jgi:hypothetical protein
LHADGIDPETEIGRLAGPGPTQGSVHSEAQDGQWRVDTIEFYALSQAMKIEPIGLFKALAARLPRDVDI